MSVIPFSQTCRKDLFVRGWIQEVQLAVTLSAGDHAHSSAFDSAPLTYIRSAADAAREAGDAGECA
eukprot:5102473-Prymnesium_polylepis.1